MTGRDPMLKRPGWRDAAELVARIRPGDAEEIRLFTGEPVALHVCRAIKRSPCCYSMRAGGDGPLLCVFGAFDANVMTGEAILWELSTTAVESHKAEFAAKTLGALRRICEDMPHVEAFTNAVPESHSRTLRWLRWFGAHMGDPFDFGGTSVVPFAIEAARYRRT